MRKWPMAPVNPGNSPSRGRGRTFSSRGSDSISVYWTMGGGMTVAPGLAAGGESRLLAMNPCAWTVKRPAVSGMKVVS